MVRLLTLHLALVYVAFAGDLVARWRRKQNAQGGNPARLSAGCGIVACQCRADMDYGSRVRCQIGNRARASGKGLRVGKPQPAHGANIAACFTDDHGVLEKRI